MVLAASASLSAPVSDAQCLYRQHHGWLRGWLQHRVGCSEQAADLAQDTFVRVLLRPSLAALREPRAYLTTIAKGLVTDHWRRRAVEQAYLDALATLPAALVPSPEERLAWLQALHQLDIALTALPARAREAFLLSQLDGLGYAQIAERLGVTERSVKRYMAQGFEACLLALD